VRALWGLSLILLNALVAAYTVAFCSTLVSLLVGIGGRQPLGRLFLGPRAAPFLAIIVIAALLVSLALLVVSVVHILMASGLPRDAQVLWVIVVLLGMQPGMLAYWWTNVRRDTLRSQ
jgi:hypothetical protein